MPHSDEPAEAASPRHKLFARMTRAIAVLSLGLVPLGLSALGIVALKVRADLVEAQTAAPPVTVATLRLKREASYEITRRFVGRLEASRETTLAFERAGRIAEIMVREGARVAAGDVIARLETSRLTAQQAELNAQITELEARLDLARATAGRQETLRQRGWAPEQRFDEARFTVAEIEAGIARVRAALDTLSVDISHMTLVAPFDGVIGDRLLDEGATVSPGAPLATLFEDGRVVIRTGLPAAMTAGLEPGSLQPFRADGEAGPVTQLSFLAQLDTLRPDLDPRSRTVTALFSVDRTEVGSLPLGAVVRLERSVLIEDDGAWLPLTALSEGAKGLWSVLTVKTINGQATIARDAVEILHVRDGRAFVRSAIPEGTPIVERGVNRIIPGQIVAMVDAQRS
ncbi:MAG: efflux RND transporter periplasmic adaptor subunit [Hyphomicrobiaceae bacterium]